MARRLKTISRDINQTLGHLGYVARVEPWSYNTDRKIGRLRHPGKGREGNRLVVRLQGVEVFVHNAAETYRHNDEVEEWLRRRKEDLAKKHLTFST